MESAANTTIVQSANRSFMESSFTGNVREHQLDGSFLATLVDLHHIDGHGLAVCVYPSDTLVDDLAIHLGNDVDRMIIDNGFRVSHRRLGPIDLETGQ